jgi:hypothetical protein
MSQNGTIIVTEQATGHGLEVAAEISSGRGGRLAAGRPEGLHEVAAGQPASVRGSKAGRLAVTKLPGNCRSNLMDTGDRTRQTLKYVPASIVRKKRQPRIIRLALGSTCAHRNSGK